MNPFDELDKQQRKAEQEARDEETRQRAIYASEMLDAAKRRDKAIEEADKEREAAIKQGTADADRELDERIRRICREEIEKILKERWTVAEALAQLRKEAGL